MSQRNLLLVCSPETEGADAVLPHLYGAVFGAGGVELAVWGEGDTPDGTVVPFVYICFYIRIRCRVLDWVVDLRT
jgi:hypothetical protein